MKKAIFSFLLTLCSTLSPSGCYLTEHGQNEYPALPDNIIVDTFYKNGHTLKIFCSLDSQNIWLRYADDAKFAEWKPDELKIPTENHVHIQDGFMDMVVTIGTSHGHTLFLRDVGVYFVGDDEDPKTAVPQHGADFAYTPCQRRMNP